MWISFAKLKERPQSIIPANKRYVLILQNTIFQTKNNLA